MSKRRKKVSLFEAVSGDGKGALQTPDWLSSTSQPASQQAPAAEPIESTPVPAQPMATTPAPVVATTGGSLQLTLNYVSCSVICLALAVLTIGSYKLGQRSVTSAATSETVTDVSDPLAGSPGAVGEYDFAAAQAEANERCARSGQLLLIQTGVTSKADAQAIQKFLRNRGFTPLVAPQEDGGYAVIDTVNVSSMSKADIEDYRRRLADLGRDGQWKLRARYDFSRSQIYQIPAQ